MKRLFDNPLVGLLIGFAIFIIGALLIVRAQAENVVFWGVNHTVCVPPSAGLIPIPGSGIVPLSVLFIDTSTGSNSSKTLDFGDGSPITNMAGIFHTYTSTGDFTATLTYYSDCGTSAFSSIVYITGTNSASFIFTNGSSFNLGNICSNTTADTVLTITNLSSTPITSSTVQVNNNIGNAFSVPAGSNWVATVNGKTNVTIRLIPTTQSTYSGQVIFTTSNDGSRTGIIMATRQALPVALFSSNTSNGVAPLIITFTNASTTATNYDYIWGDGSSSLGVMDATVSKTYTNGNTNLVQLIAYGSCGISTSSYNIGMSITNDFAGLVWAAQGNASNYFESASGTKLSPLTNFTIEVWYQNSDSALTTPLLSQGSNGVEEQVALWLINGEVKGENNGMGTGVHPSVNTWHHLAYIYSVTNRYIFIDGTNSVTGGGGLSFDPANMRWSAGGLGVLSADSSGQLLIDQITIWTNLPYGSTTNFIPVCRTSNQAGMLSRYNFDEIGGSNATDAVSSRTLFILNPVAPFRASGRTCP